jgi:hypothetical protein
LYFSRLYAEAPMQHPERYLASLYLPPHMQPPMCLQYIVLALAASLSHVHDALAQPYYHRARNYIQLDEMKVGSRFRFPVPANTVLRSRLVVKAS